MPVSAAVTTSGGTVWLPGAVNPRAHTPITAADLADVMGWPDVDSDLASSGRLGLLKVDNLKDVQGLPLQVTEIARINGAVTLRVVSKHLEVVPEGGELPTVTLDDVFGGKYEQILKDRADCEVKMLLHGYPAPRRY